MFGRVKGFSVALALILSVVVPGFSQEKDVPTPTEYLKKNIAEDKVLADWQEIESYFKKVAEVSPRVSLKGLGKSSNNNNIIAALITSAENQKKLEELIALQKEITWKEQQEKENWEKNKVFLVINCSMHSTEIGASQMSMLLLHSMATGNDEFTREALNKLVIVLIPSSNPDGINWISHWYNKWLGSEYEGLRYPFLYQEYSGHDNNRDWFMLNLKETRVLNRWMSKVWYPQIVWDMHQMGSQGWRAIIPPFVGPPNPFLHPLVLTGVENAGHAMKYQMVADGNGGVAHSQTFSIWWNGGFRNTPYFKNSIGLLSELASADIASRITVTPEVLTMGRGDANHLAASIKNPLPWEGGTWGLKEIISYELSAAKGLIKFASRNQEEILVNYRRMCLDASSKKTGIPGGYIFPANQLDLTAVNRLADIMQEHDIRVEQLLDDIDFKGVNYPAGSIVISADQPFRPMIRSLLERLNYPIDAEEGSNPYDVNASTLPDMMAVDFETMDLELFSKFSQAAKVGKYRPLELDIVSTSSGQTFYPATNSESFSKVNEIISLGGFIRRESLETESGEEDVFVQYDPSRDARAMDITADINKAREESLKIPRIGLLRGNLNSISEGWTRWVLEEFKFPFGGLDEKRVKRGNLLADFDTIVLPSIREGSMVNGSSAKAPEGYESGIGRLGMQSLEKFVLEGGTLVCIAESCRPVIKHFELPVADELRGLDKEDFVIHGSLINLDVVTEHPLAFGMPEKAAVMFFSSLAFSAPEEETRVSVVARYSQRETLLAGYSLGEEFIAGKAAMVEVKHGDGKVILIGFPCQFRGQTWSTFKLLFNSLYNEGLEKQELDFNSENIEG